MRKERFSKQRKSKLQPREDEPFQVLERINDNAYKIDIPGEYGVCSSFNVADLTPFVVVDDSEDLRANAFQEGGCHTLISSGDLCLMTGDLCLVLVRCLAPIIRLFVKFRDMPENKRKY